MLHNCSGIFTYPEEFQLNLVLNSRDDQGKGLHLAEFILNQILTYNWTNKCKYLL